MLMGRGKILPELKVFKNLLFLALEEDESEVLQCRMECSLVGEQEQRHSAGIYWYSWFVVDGIYFES